MLITAKENGRLRSMSFIRSSEPRWLAKAGARRGNPDGNEISIAGDCIRVGRSRFVARFAWRRLSLPTRLLF